VCTGTGHAAVSLEGFHFLPIPGLPVERYVYTSGGTLEI